MIVRSGIVGLGGGWSRMRMVIHRMLSKLKLSRLACIAKPPTPALICGFLLETSATHIHVFACHHLGRIIIVVSYSTIGVGCPQSRHRTRPLSRAFTPSCRFCSKPQRIGDPQAVAGFLAIRSLHRPNTAQVPPFLHSSCFPSASVFADDRSWLPP